MAQVDGYAFTPAQVSILRNLGLSATEIKNLEVQVLPRIAPYLVVLPALNPVRGVLEDLFARVNDLGGALALAFQPGDDEAAAEAMRRIAKADYDREVMSDDRSFSPSINLQSAGSRVESAREALTELSTVLRAAIADLPDGQRRPVAAWQPLEQIHFEVPRFHPGRKQFRELVETCFQAAGASDDLSLDGRIRKYREVWESGMSAVPRPSNNG